jgi:ABC-2 type transport system permease protein
MAVKVVSPYAAADDANIPSMSTQAVAVPERRRIRGPSALGSDPRRFVQLTRTLAVSDFKLKFFGSVLGYLWQLMRPLMLFGVLYLVFVQFVRLGGETVPHYPGVLLIGIVTYMFFASSTGGCVTAVLKRETLVRKIEFPRLVIPLTVVLVAYFDLVLNFIAVFIFVLANGVEPRWTWLELIPLLMAVGVLATGIGMLVSALYVRFRDVEPIWEVLLQVFFYVSPILYPIELVAERGGEDVQQAMMLNPLAAILQQMRHAVIDPNAQSAGAAAGGWVWILIPAGIIIGLFALGLWVFNREAPRIAEEL